MAKLNETEIKELARLIIADLLDAKFIRWAKFEDVKNARLVVERTIRRFVRAE